MNLKTRVEQETEEEVILRLQNRPTTLQFPKSEQVRKFYQRYGIDWIKRFYHDNISIAGLPHEVEDREIGY